MMKTFSIREVIAFGLFAVALVFLLFARAEARDLRALKIEAEHTRDSLAANAAGERARANGWQTLFAEADPEGLQEALDAKSDTLKTLAADLAASGVRVESLLEVVGTLGDSLTSLATDVVFAEGEEGQPPTVVRFSGKIDEPPLRASWTCGVPNRDLDFSYLATITGELVSSRTGDGRITVFARATSPNTMLELGDLFFDPPAPQIQVRGVKWWWLPDLTIPSLPGANSDRRSELPTACGQYLTWQSPVP